MDLMRIQFSFVGLVERHDDVWVDLPAVPRVGETVEIPGLSQADTVVRTVVWYFVYVVLGKPRRARASAGRPSNCPGSVRGDGDPRG
jgi:hypothetical protein